MKVWDWIDEGRAIPFFGNTIGKVIENWSNPVTQFSSRNPILSLVTGKGNLAGSYKPESTLERNVNNANFAAAAIYGGGAAAGALGTGSTGGAAGGSGFTPAMSSFGSTWTPALGQAGQLSGIGTAMGGEVSTTPLAGAAGAAGSGGYNLNNMYTRSLLNGSNNQSGGGGGMQVSGRSGMANDDSIEKLFQGGQSPIDMDLVKTLSEKNPGTLDHAILKAALDFKPPQDQQKPTSITQPSLIDQYSQILNNSLQQLLKPQVNEKEAALHKLSAAMSNLATGMQRGDWSHQAASAEANALEAQGLGPAQMRQMKIAELAEKGLGHEYAREQHAFDSLPVPDDVVQRLGFPAGTRISYGQLAHLGPAIKAMNPSEKTGGISNLGKLIKEQKQYEPGSPEYIRYQKEIDKEGKEPTSIDADYLFALKKDLKKKHPDWDDNKISLEATKQARKENQSNKIQVAVVGGSERAKAFADERYYSTYDTSRGQTVRIKGRLLNNDESGRYLDPSDPEVGALKDLTKRKELIGTFTNRIDENTKVVERIAKKYGNQAPRLVNMPVNKLAQVMGSGDYASLKLALKSLSNEIAKVESGSLGISEVSVEQAKYMEKIHDADMTFGDLMKVLETGKQLGKTSMSAINKQRKDLQNRMKGSSGVDYDAIDAELKRRGK